ncbi:MAG: hypothetical protein RJA36_2867 [Pseudomonadota bacterium]|jgi:FAD/FMN-containing dehydrogenase
MNAGHHDQTASDLHEVPAALLELRRVLGLSAVLIGAEVPARNCRDWSSQPGGTPLAVVRPADTAGMAAAVRACHEAGLPMVPQGGLTGLSGGAQPSAGCVVLSLERLTGIEEIDPAAGTLTARAGTPLEQIQQAADEAGCYFALDLGARGSCTIGGNLATNAGGNRVLRYGMTRELVLGLEAVLPDGRVLSNLNKMLKNNAGYDLKQLFIGSEGTLGIVTRVVLRLHPKPGCTMSALCALPGFGAAVELLQQARTGLGPMLSAFEVMWPDYWDAALDLVGLGSPLPGRHGCYLLIEAQGTEEAVDAPRFESWLERMLELGLLEDAALARSVADTQAFWSLRDACGEFPQAIGAHVSYDIGLKLGDMDAYVGRCKAALARVIPGCRSVYYGHVGDGNIHIDAWIPGLDARQQPKDAIDAIVYGLVREYGGTISAEHGIGTTKRQWLPHARSAEELSLMHTLKQALDPLSLLNPGKVLPTCPKPT